MLVMGILNLTPDSFADGGRHNSFDAGVAKQTPYSADDTKNADDQVLTAEKFRVGRGGQVNDVLYSSTVDRG